MVMILPKGENLSSTSNHHPRTEALPFRAIWSSHSLVGTGDNFSNGDKGFDWNFKLNFEKRILAGSNRFNETITAVCLHMSKNKAHQDRRRQIQICSSKCYHETQTVLLGQAEAHPPSAAKSVLLSVKSGQ